MSKLFEKAMRDYEVALDMEKKYFEDEDYADQTCYHLQQAHEKALKFLSEINGVAPQRVHNITRLLQDLDSAAIEYPAEIAAVADMLTSWEANSRYNDDFIATKGQIQLAKQSFEALQACIYALL